jgi:hypothetical protein
VSEYHCILGQTPPPACSSTRRNTGHDHLHALPPRPSSVHFTPGRRTGAGPRLSAAHPGSLLRCRLTARGKFRGKRSKNAVGSAVNMRDLAGQGESAASRLVSSRPVSSRLGGHADGSLSLTDIIRVNEVGDGTDDRRRRAVDPRREHLPRRRDVPLQRGVIVSLRLQPRYCRSLLDSRERFRRA